MSVRAKRFRIRKDITDEEIKKYRLGSVGDTPDSGKIFCYQKQFTFDVPESWGAPVSEATFTLIVSFRGDARSWNDLENVHVIDDYCGWPYVTFNRRLGFDVDNDPCLMEVIRHYNDYMSSLPFLEEIPGSPYHYYTSEDIMRQYKEWRYYSR